MKAMLWNHEKLVEVELKPDSETPIHEQVNEILGCRCMTSIQFNTDLEAYVDDEGLLHDEPRYGALWIDPDTNKIHQPIGGKLLFVNHNNMGETTGLSYTQMKMIQHLKRHRLVDIDNRYYEALLIPFYRREN